MRSLILGGVASMLLTSTASTEPVTPVIPVIVIPPTTEDTSVLPKVETELCPPHLSIMDELLDERCWNYQQILAEHARLVTPITVFASPPEALWAFNYRDESWPGDQSYKVWATTTKEYCDLDRLGLPADKVSTSACVYTREYELAR